MCIRDSSYIGDVNPVIVDGGLSDLSNSQIFNVGSAESVTINELADLIRDIFFDGEPWPEGLEPKYLPDRPLEVKNAFCSHEAAERILGFKNVTTLRKGLESMVSWARDIGAQDPIYLSDSLELGRDRAPATWRDQLI